MLTTGLGPAHESIPRGAREIQAPSLTGQEAVVGPTPALAPTDCPLCGDVEAEPIAVCSDFERSTTRDAFLALRCSDCGSVYLSPAPVLTEPPLRSNEGAGAADLSRVGRRIAHSARGLDPSRVLLLSKRGDSSIDPGPLGRENLQLILLDRALEYSPSPMALLAGLRAALHRDGEIIVILENLASPTFTIFGGRHWAGYDVPGQCALYSTEGIRRLAGRAGLEVRSISTAPDPACWVESCRRALNDWRAPAWLTRRFGRKTVVSRAAFGLLEGMLQWRRRGAILIASLKKAAEAGPTAPAARSDFA